MAGKHSKQKPVRKGTRKRGLLVAVIILTVLLITAGGIATVKYVDVKAITGRIILFDSVPIKQPPRVSFCPLDGTKITGDTLKDIRPIIVKVENHTDARPQSGLDKADIIIEAMAEGGITRFAVVFWCRTVDEIGPVRSARLQDFNFIQEYDALFAHIGASDTFTNEKPNGIADLDEFAYGNAYWRDDKRFAPHNCYTSTEKLRQTAKDAGFEHNVTIAPLKFGKLEGTAATAISISYPEDCDASYAYDAKTKTYLRSVSGEPHTDKPTGKQLAPANVVVQFIQYEDSDYGEEYGIGGRQIMQLTGEGRALIFSNGVVVDGRWSRPGDESMTVFTDQEGNTVPLARGQTWIEIVPDGWDIPYSAGQ